MRNYGGWLTVQKYRVRSMCGVDIDPGRCFLNLVSKFASSIELNKSHTVGSGNKDLADSLTIMRKCAHFTCAFWFI